MRNIALAHKLYYECEIGRFVPEETYETIAEILKWIEELEKEKEQEEAMLDIFKS
jgi:flagellar biosynthesis protein FlhB